MRFIKNRLVDLGMIKPTEFLNLFSFSCLFCMLFWSYVRMFLLQTIWIKTDSIRASMSECGKISRPMEGVACPLSLCIRLDNPSSLQVCLMELFQPHSGRFYLEMFYDENVIGFKFDSKQSSKFCL